MREEWASLSFAHPFSSPPPLPTKAPLPCSFFPSFKSIFRLLVGETRYTRDKNNTQCCWLTRYLYSRTAYKICIPFIFYELPAFCVSSNTLKCQKVTFEINQIALMARRDHAHVLYQTRGKEKPTLTGKRLILFECCLLYKRRKCKFLLLIYRLGTFRKSPAFRRER